MTVVGIDLGTTNTVIAAVRDGRATALKDKLGKALLPSIVSFTPRGGAKIGHEAKARRTLDPDNTVFSIKRLIGRSFDSEHVQKAQTRFPFELKEGPGRSVLVSAYGEDHTLPEISALVLRQAVEIAEARLGTPVTDAVITVPANFNDLQRAATKIAGRTAGLEVLRIINEPTAAALAYGFGKSGHERIAIYDFGGGTFDVTILDLNENVFEVLATAGDTFLGGDDIDEAIMDRMAEKLLAEQKVDAEKDNLVREQLRAAAETLKIDLSTRSLAKIRIDELEFEFTMRRSEFEKLTEPLLARTLTVAKQAMEIAGLDNSGLDQVLLVGGSTRIPLVRRRISSFFGKMPQSRINPDEVVAIGAAIQASSLEAKQGSASIPAAPGRSLSHPARRLSNAPPPSGSDPSRTRTGLAGLSKTLSGPAGGSQAPGRSGSSLKSLQSIPPAVANLQGSAGKLSPAKTLSGVGGSLSPAPLGDKVVEAGAKATALPDENRGKSTTNLGLGVQPSVPPMTFDDVTAVAPSPDVAAADLDREASKPRQGTLPGNGEHADLFDGYEYGNEENEEVLDGSVTFDLASLGLEDGEPNSLADIDEETTQVYDSRRSHSLPATPSDKAEEIGDSALFSLDEADENDEADLPSPASKRSGESLTDSVISALQGEPNLPSVSAHGLSTTKMGLPSAVSPDRGSDEESDELENTEVGHRSPHADLPLRAKRPQNLPATKADALPSLGADHLPAKTAATRTQLGPLVAIASRPTSQPPPVELDFDGAIQRSPPLSPSLEDLDELSVAALLPDDESFDEPHVTLDPDEADIPLSGGGASFSPGAFLRQSAAAPAAEARNQVPPTGTPRTSGPSSAPPSAGRGRAAPLLLDVTPLSLGVEVSGGYVDRLIARNSPIPCESIRTFATTKDNQPIVRVRVSQGEEDRFNKNTLLGELELTGLSPGPRGTVKVDVSFALDESGLLEVTARDVASGNATNARLTLVGVSE